MGGVLQHKWEAYCSTNGRRIAGFPFPRSLEARKVGRCKWGAYCRTNWRCTAVLFRQVVGVGVSETLPNRSNRTPVNETHAPLVSPFSLYQSQGCVHKCSKNSESRKGGLSKGASCAKQTFLQGNGLPSAVLQGNGLPSAVVTRHPLGLGKSNQSRTGLSSCKSHLQVQTPQGRSLASASGSGQAIDLCFERSPFK